MSNRAQTRRGSGRHETAPARLPAQLLAIVLGASLVVASLSMLVAIRAAQLQNGYRLYALSREKAELIEQRSHLQVEVAALKRPDRLARVAVQLGLEPVRPDQVIRANDPASAPLRAEDAASDEEAP